MTVTASKNDGGMSPAEWATHLSADAVLDARDVGWTMAELRSWRGVEPESYPALDHHCVTLHLGAPRRIVRRGEGRTRIADIRPGALSVTPHGAAFDWRTTGPVDYAELYVSPTTIQERWGDTPEAPSLTAIGDCLGAEDALAEQLLRAMLREVELGRAASTLLLDSLFASLWLRLSRVCQGRTGARTAAVSTLSGRRLARVVDYIEAHLTRELDVAQLAGIAAMSPFHFSRAFKASTGLSPYAFVIGRRIACAQRHLATGSIPIEEVAAACGFRTPAQFGRMFRRATGTTARRYRQETGG